MNVLVKFWSLFWYKIEMFHISCIVSLLFIIVPTIESRAHSLYLFSYQNFDFVFESVAFLRITICTEQELSYRIVASSPRYLLWNMWMQLLWISHFVLYFFSEEALQGLWKNNPTEKQIHTKIQVTMKCAPARRRTEENAL